MTPTLLFWIRTGAIVLIAYTIYTMLRPMIRRGYLLPRARKEWTQLGSDLFSLAAGAFLLFILQKNYSEPMDAVMAYKGGELPAFRFLNTRTGAEETLDKYAGEVVILNIWATWCPPCRREMPELDALQKEFAGKVQVLAVSDESEEKIRSFNASHSYTYPTAVFTRSNEWLQRIGTRPVSILLVNGKVKDIVVGARGYSFFRNWVLSYL